MTDLREEKPPVKSYCGGKPNYCTPEQEPVAWMWNDGSLTSDPYEADGTWTKLYTAPPKREWVGLTDEDYDELLTGDWGGSLIQATEAKLKEKNT